MATIKTTIRTPATVRTIVRATGRPGIPGPNEITTSTSTPITGVLVGDAGTVRAATDSEIVTEAELVAAIEAERYRISGPPTEILAGENYIVPERRQVGFRYPITIAAGGVLSIQSSGILYEV
jgi:hypothetical protein